MKTIFLFVLLSLTIVFLYVYVVTFVNSDTIIFTELAQYAIDGLRYSLEKLSKNGITSVVDARSFWLRKDDLVWQKLEENGELPVRAILALWAYPELDDEKQVKFLSENLEPLLDKTSFDNTILIIF